MTSLIDPIILHHKSPLSPESGFGCIDFSFLIRLFWAPFEVVEDFLVVAIFVVVAGSVFLIWGGGAAFWVVCTVRSLELGGLTRVDGLPGVCLDVAVGRDFFIMVCVWSPGSLIRTTSSQDDADSVVVVPVEVSRFRFISFGCVDSPASSSWLLRMIRLGNGCGRLNWSWYQIK